MKNLQFQFSAFSTYFVIFNMPMNERRVGNGSFVFKLCVSRNHYTMHVFKYFNLENMKYDTTWVLNAS